MQGIQKTATNSPVANTNQTQSTSGAVNPPHGKPGRRCDLAVGAPLNSSPSQNLTPNTAQQVVNTQPAATVTQQTVQNTSTTSTALNPKHGEPGHRCDIAVGAPLNSKPKQVAATQQITTQAVPQAATAATPMFNEKGQRLNPAHGQSGHKCEIAVGAPLT